MRSKIVPILLALIVLGAVLGIAALMLVLLGQDWEDALFWILAAVMLGAAFLVVTLKDIIRCGLAMIVSFMALAGIYVLMGAPLLGAAQVIVYIGAISVLVLFAIMLTQTKDAPSRLVFQTQAVPAAIENAKPTSVSPTVGIVWRRASSRNSQSEATTRDGGGSTNALSPDSLA